MLNKKRKICVENVFRDFGIVRGNVFKTQRKETNQTEKTDKKKTEFKENNGIREMK